MRTNATTIETVLPFRRSVRCYATVVRLLACLVIGLGGIQAIAAEKPVDFAKQIAPLFERHCMRCHKPGNKQGELSLATLAELLESGYLVQGKPEESHLLEVLLPASKGERPAMPKEGKPLSDVQITLIREWIQQGAEWPKQMVLREPSRADASWWSLQPLHDFEPPEVSEAPVKWQASPLDRFIFVKLKENGLAPSPRADRRTLIRRATYDLTGLPPTPEEVQAFLDDDSPDAWGCLIDRLLDSPHYGERWGRHWLDVVRFGESNGFERNVIIDNLWPFRDYIIQSFNDDKPFDQLVREHLAGDVIGKNAPEVAIGTAFLVCGPYDNVGNRDPVQAAQIRANTIDEMIRVTTEAFLGLTVGCARCHDHKFDPLLQQDYYSLYATFAGVTHGSQIVASDEQKMVRAEKLRPLQEEQSLLTKQKQSLQNDISQRAKTNAAQYESKWTRPSVSRYGTEEIFEPIEAKHIRLVVLGRDDQPAVSTGFRIDEFEAWTDDSKPRNVALAVNGGQAEGASRVAQDFADAYSANLTIDGKFGARWIATGSILTITFGKQERISRVLFSSDRAEELDKHPKTAFVGEYRLEVSNDGESWQEVGNSFDRKPAGESHRQHRLFELTVTDNERKKLAELNRALSKISQEIAKVPALPSWWVGNFSTAKGPFHLFLGGDPQKKGPEVSLTSFNALDRTEAKYELPPEAAEAERRVALANWIVHENNPVTPRVLANRLWHYHFGTGIVATPSDFGYMGGRPSHSELLDWLAGQIHHDGWKLKPLHRLIMLSETYQQASAFRKAAAVIDADARLLWRFPPRRLSAEEIRDTMLAVSVRGIRKKWSQSYGEATPNGEPFLGQGGPGFRLYDYLQDNVATYVPLDHHGLETYRRAVYHQNARATRVDLMTDFDCPDPAFAASRRASTTTPLQALTLLNHSFTVEMANAMADRLKDTSGDEIDNQIQRAFLAAYSRTASQEELKAARTIVSQVGLRALCRALFNSNEFIYLK